ncbi:hypothetical protein POTOM_017641 [Populus tomentosa]|uniref:Ariadne domain-containing protein n=1 Tax=Populus tomentosa TaxID=118781 RepID=A0A8X7ZZ90_POPTO|nr:hypothetical protein POTOM_017641 [Populus tomentosa]
MELLSLKERRAQTLLIRYQLDVEKLLAVLIRRTLALFMLNLGVCGATGRDHTWSRIVGHSCGHYKEDRDKQTERAKQDLYYHNRYKAHTNSLKFESKLRESIPCKVSVAQERELRRKDFSWVFNCNSSLISWMVPSKCIIPFKIGFVQFCESRCCQKLLMSRMRSCIVVALLCPRHGVGLGSHCSSNNPCPAFYALDLGLCVWQYRL